MTSLTLPDDKKNQLKKELVPVEEKLVLVKTFEEKVMKINEFCTSLKSFDDALKEIDGWMLEATKELEAIKQASDKLTPEDRVSRTMDLQEDIAAKVEIIEMNVKCELDLLPQGNLLNTLIFNTFKKKSPFHLLHLRYKSAWPY